MPPSVTCKRLPKSRVQCTVVFSSEDATAAEKKALERLGQAMKFPGFRPGKAPVDLIREKAGPEELLEETVRMLLPEAVREAATKEALVPIMPPQASIEKKDPLTVVLTFVERPNVTVKASKIKLEKKEIKVEDKDIEKMLTSMQSEKQSATAVDRAAKSGDRVTVNIRGEDEEKKPIEGSDIKDRPIVIGSNTLIPGFEDALIGLKTGEQKQIPLRFPEKYHAEHLQGKPVTFHVEVKGVEEMMTPELTDSFAKEHFGVDSVDALKGRLRDAMREQEERIEAERRESGLFDAIRDATSVELPEELVAEEVQNLTQDFLRSLEERGIKLEQWMKTSKKTAKDLHADLEKRAQERLTLRFGVEQLIKDKEIAVSDDEMKAAIASMLEQVDPAERERIVPLYEKDGRNYDQLKWQKTVEKLVHAMLN